jgi:hypothetical protein
MCTTIAEIVLVKHMPLAVQAPQDADSELQAMLQKLMLV